MPCRRWTALVVACVLLCTAAPPAAALNTSDRLDRARSQLHDVQADAGLADRRVAGARAALARADERLAEATDELQQVERGLGQARAAHRLAQTETGAATERLQQAEVVLRRHLDELAGRQRQLEQHVASTYMYGDPRAGVLSSITDARSPNEFTSAVRYLRSTQDADRALIDATAAAALQAQRQRETIAALQQGRVDQERAALRAAGDAEDLLRRRQQLVVEVRDQRRERQRILAALRDDAAAAGALVAQIGQQVARLSERLAAEQRAVALAAQQRAAAAAAAAAPTRTLPGPAVVDVDTSGPTPVWSALLPDAGQSWAPAITAAAEQAGVDPRLFASLVWAESAFRAEATSRVGAQGLSQLMPATAAALGVNPADPLQNLDGGARFLAQQLQRFGAPELALAAYNAGPGAVARHGGVPPYPETQAYVLRILSLYEQLAAV